MPFQLGRPRPELREDIRSFPYHRHVIFFRYVGDVLEVVNILEGHRDVEAFFEDPNEPFVERMHKGLRSRAR